MKNDSEFTFGVQKKCPACGSEFEHRKLRTRKISPREISRSLRNEYEENAEHPDPIIYTVVVCPSCLFSAWDSEFESARPELSTVRSSRRACEEIALRFQVEPSQMNEPRTKLLGLLSYYFTEVWYKHRSDNVPSFFRRGLSACRRIWLLEDILAENIWTPEFIAGEISGSYREMAEMYETSFLGERLPDNFYCGPDYGYEFGEAGVPYLIAYANFCLSKRKSFQESMRLSYRKKAGKFLQVTSRWSAKSGSIELRRQLDLLNREYSNDQPIVDDVEVKGRSFTPVIEKSEWSLPLEKLYERFGHSFEAGDMILREGDESRDMYFILEGRAKVVKKYRVGSEDHYKLIALLDSGAIFGEMGLLDGEPRFAAITADTAIRAIRVTRNDLMEVIQAYPEVAIQIMKILSSRLRNYDDFVRNHMLKLVALRTTGSSEEAKALESELEGLLQEVEV